MSAAPLDHIVINTLRGMDGAAGIFAALGFSLTPLGRHSLGSINHLMMTPGPYLELVGVPDTGRQRQDVLDSPFGLNGLVLRSNGADETYARLRDAGFPASAPSTFSRPVKIDGAAVEARFRTVRLPVAAFPEGRVYFCQHLTPDYVWREEWFDHANGFCMIDKLIIESPDPEAAAARYAGACGVPVAHEGDIWRIALDAFAIEIIAGPGPRFMRLGMQFRDLGVLEARAGALPGAAWCAENPGAATLSLPGLALHLDCRRAS
jgi:hypothetical protein